MPVTVMTSCSLSGWESYGHKFLNSFHQHWPLDVNLHIVSEHKLPVPASIIARRPILTWDLIATSQIAKSFYDRHANNPKSHGMMGRPSGGPAIYNFRFDAVKFSKKVYAIKLVADCLKGSGVNGRLIWLDADTMTYAPMSMELLGRLPPAGFALACLDRGSYHSECGFIGYDLDNPLAHKFITAFADLYSRDEVFRLQEWHDSWVFDWLRRKNKVPSYHIPHKSTGHPFVHSELGRYMDHLKGARKQMGSSPDHPRFQRNAITRKKMPVVLTEHERAQGLKPHNK